MSNPTLLYTAGANVNTRLVKFGNNIYFGDLSGFLYGIDINGNNLTGFPIDTLKPVVDIGLDSSGNIYANSDNAGNDGTTKKYNSSGIIQWTTTFGTSITKIYMSDRAYISTNFIGDATDTVQGLKLTDGSVDKIYNICNNSQSLRVAIIGNFIYIPTAGGGPGPGCASQIRKYNKESELFIDSFSAESGSDIGTNLITDGSNIYFGQFHNGTFYKINTSLVQQWSHLTGGLIDCTPLLDSNLVFFGNDDDNIYALNVSNGSSAWSFNTGGDVNAKPIIDGNSIYVGSINGLFRLNKTHGTFIQSWPIGPITQDLLTDGIKIYFATSDKIYELPSEIISPSNFCRAIIFDGSPTSSVWAGLFTSPFKLLKINPIDNSFITITGATGENFCAALTFDGVFVWAGLYISPFKVLKINPDNNSYIVIDGGVDENLCTSLTFDGIYIWAGLDTSPVKILKINPADNSFVTITGIAGENQCKALAYDGNFVWAALGTSPVKLLKINPQSNTYTVIDGAVDENIGRALTFDGTYLWTGLDTIPFDILKKFVFLRKSDIVNTTIPFTNQAVVTGSRAIDGSVFHNTNATTMMVSVSIQPSAAGLINVFTDSNPNPITQVLEMTLPATVVGFECLSFMVLAGNYYKITNDGAAGTLGYWTEWY